MLSCKFLSANLSLEISAVLGMTTVATPACEQEATCGTTEAPASVPENGAAASTGLADIPLTVQRRAENLQNRTLMMTALTGEAIAERQITGIEDLARGSLGIIDSQ